MRIILLGPPGSGKGTLAADLSRHFSIPHISTGDLFRHHMRTGTPLGRLAESHIRSGGLVPDSVTVDMVRERLAQPDCADGFLLDGFPRTEPQAHALAAMLAESGQALDHVLDLRVRDDTIIRRLSGRRLCPACGAGYNLVSAPPRLEGVCDACGKPLEQRADDRAETVLRRLETYHAQTAPLVGFYEAQGLLMPVPNEGSPAEAFETALRLLGRTA